MLHRVLRREGVAVNHKRIERLYREEGLSLRRRRACKRFSHLRVVREQPPGVNHTWTVDFVHDALRNGRRFRAFNVIDEFSPECLAIEVGASLPGVRISQLLQRLSELRTAPRIIRSDSGPEFRGRVMDEWAWSAVAPCAIVTAKGRIFLRCETHRAQNQGTSLRRLDYALQ